MSIVRSLSDSNYLITNKDDHFYRVRFNGTTVTLLDYPITIEMSTFALLLKHHNFALDISDLLIGSLIDTRFPLYEPMCMQDGFEYKTLEYHVRNIGGNKFRYCALKELPDRVLYYLPDFDVITDSIHNKRFLNV